VSPHHPGGDPILAAGNLRCGGCGALSYPVAAEWLTQGLILVSYDQHHEHGCARRSACGTVLLDRDAPTQEVPAVHRPRICRGTATSTGQPCRAAAAPGSGYCYHHNPARRAAS
jgi:hypothetical protein